MNWKPEDRLIFEYHNGERKVFGDPLVLTDALFSVSQGSYKTLIDKVRAIDAAKDDIPVIMEGLEARAHLETISRQVFGMVPYDNQTGKGAMRENCLTTLFSFLLFKSQKKTNSAQPLTTSPSTATTPLPSISPVTPTTSA